MDQAVTDHLRERLIDYIARLRVPRVRPVDGVVAISAESMADVLLPFVREELANRPPTQDAYDAACAALWKHRGRVRELEAVIAASPEEFRCISCGGLDPRCGAYHPEYGFTCILPKPHSGPHYDTAGGHWDRTLGQLQLDRCNPSTGYHSSPHRGCILR